MTEPIRDIARRTLVCLPSMPEAERLVLTARLASTGHGSNLTIATPDEVISPVLKSSARVISYTPISPPTHSWILTAWDYRNASQLLRDHQCSHALLLGGDAATLSEQFLGCLLDAITNSNAAIVFPKYEFSAQKALVNAAILYPLTQALYGAKIHFPLPFDIAFNAAAGEQLGNAAARVLPRGPDTMLWTVAEAAAGGLAMDERECGSRAVPAPPSEDLTDLLSLVVGSLFADAESKAAVWQRSRAFVATTASANPPLSILPATSSTGPGDDELPALVGGFCNAYTNLHELWSLVLPPQSLLALKRLSQSSMDDFMMADSLWVRIVYDFLLAYRLRTLNQTHLLGALTPLYLAWAASHLRIAGDDTVRAQQHIEALATAFRTDKPYLLGRWRWPDRFNP